MQQQDQQRVKPLTEKRVVALLRRHIFAHTVGDDIPSEAMASYRAAVCHESCSRGAVSYERLEFLGDSILNAIVTSYLYRRYPKENEGFMTRMRTHLVNGRMLAHLCQHGTSLVPYIAISPQLEAQYAQSGVTGIGKKNARHVHFKVLEDVFEAFIGAVFLHLGFGAAEEWVVKCLESTLDFAELAARRDTPRAVLNRYCQTSFGFLPEVESIGSGVSRLTNPLSGQVIATGRGHGDQEALSDAVQKAIEYYGISMYGV